MLCSISNDCLVQIVDYLGIDSIRSLFQSGDKMLYEKMSNNILSLKYVSDHKTSINTNQVLFVISQCKTLRSLFVTWCLYNHERGYRYEQFDCSLLPLSLIDLVVRPCNICDHNIQGRLTDLFKDNISDLPNLTRLDLDSDHLKPFPINTNISSLTSLRLHLRDDDSTLDLHEILQPLTQLTHLAIEKYFWIDTDFDELDCNSLSNLTRLSLPPKIKVKNVQQSFQSIVLKDWDEDDPYDSLFEDSQNFTSLTHLEIGYLSTDDFNDTLKRLARIAPSIEALNVAVEPEDLLINVFGIFPRLKKVNPCLCFNPAFWSSVPQDVCFFDAGDEVVDEWKFSTWFNDDGEDSLTDIQQKMSSMPAFRSIKWNGNSSTEIYLESMPHKVLEHVKHLELPSCALAHKLILLAKRLTSVTVDFFFHFIDFSNCTQLTDLQLYDYEIHEPNIAQIRNLDASIATIKSALETLRCIINVSYCSKFDPINVLTTKSLKSLRSFTTGLRLDGDYDALPPSLTHLTLDLPDWIEPALYLQIPAFLNKRSSSPLAKIVLYCKCDDSQIITIKSVSGWKLKTKSSSQDLFEFVWTKNPPPMKCL